MLCLFSQTFQAKQNKTSSFILLHNMFLPSGHDYMLNKTEMVLNEFRPLFSPESESQFKTDNTRNCNLKGLRDEQSLSDILKKRRPSGAKLLFIAPSSCSLRNSPPLQLLLHEQFGSPHSAQPQVDSSAFAGQPKAHEREDTSL